MNSVSPFVPAVRLSGCRSRLPLPSFRRCGWPVSGSCRRVCLGSPCGYFTCTSHIRRRMLHMFVSSLSVSPLEGHLHRGGGCTRKRCSHIVSAHLIGNEMNDHCCITYQFSHIFISVHSTDSLISHQSTPRSPLVDRHPSHGQLAHRTAVLLTYPLCPLGT